MFSCEVYNLLWFYYTQVGALGAPKFSGFLAYPSLGNQIEMVPANMRKIRRKTGVLRKFFLQFFISPSVTTSKTSIQVEFIEYRSKIGTKFLAKHDQSESGRQIGFLYIFDSRMFKIQHFCIWILIQDVVEVI